MDEAGVREAGAIYAALEAKEKYVEALVRKAELLADRTAAVLRAVDAAARFVAGVAARLGANMGELRRIAEDIRRDAHEGDEWKEGPQED